MILLVLLYCHLNLQFLVNKCNISVKWSCYNKILQIVRLNTRNIFSHSKLLTWSGSPPILKMATLSPRTHMAFPWFMNVETK